MGQDELASLISTSREAFVPGFAACPCLRSEKTDVMPS